MIACFKNSLILTNLKGIRCYSTFWHASVTTRQESTEIWKDWQESSSRSTCMMMTAWLAWALNDIPHKLYTHKTQNLQHFRVVLISGTNITRSFIGLNQKKTQQQMTNSPYLQLPKLDNSDVLSLAQGSNLWKGKSKNDASF